MRKWEEILWRFCIFIAVTQVTQAGHVALIGPLDSKGGNTYKAYLVARDISDPTDVAIYITCAGSTLSKKIFMEKSNFTAKEITLTLDKPVKECVLGAVVKEKDIKKCDSDQLPIINSPSDEIVMIQTDKPVYKPKEKIRYQIIALDATTKPIELNQIQVEILDGKNHQVLSKNITNITRPKFGFHQDEFMSIGEPNIGIWTINVKINGSISTAEKTFGVYNYVAPSFKVYIETPEKISWNTEKFKLKVFAKYSFDEFVRGTATVNIRICYIKGEICHQPHTRKESIDDEIVIEINIKEDLKVSYLLKDMLIRVEVEFMEEDTDLIARNVKSFVMTNKNKYKINVHQKPHFCPGIPHYIDVQITTQDEVPISIERAVIMNLRRKIEDVDSEINDKVSSFINANGKTSFTLNTTSTKKLHVKFEFEEADEYSMDLMPKKNNVKSDQYLQILVQTLNPEVGSNFNIHVQTNSLMDPLNVIVMGRTGIVFTKSFLEVEEKDKFNISIPITSEMAPESNVIVFYLKSDDGLPIYDECKIKLKWKTDNHLTIDAPKTLKPGENATINFKTLPNSLVALLGVDQSASFMDTKNTITVSQLLQMFSPNSNSYRKKLKDKNSILQDFHLFFIMLSQKTQKRCPEFHMKMFANEFNGRFGSDLVFDTRITYETKPKTEVRKNFPEIWFYEFLETHDNSEESLRKTVPDLITTWMINGISINAEKGLAIAETQNVQVFKDFFIKIDKPLSSEVNEIVTINVTVFNYMNTDARTSVTLTKKSIVDFDFFEENSGSPKKSKQYQKTINEGKKEIFLFKIKPKRAGDIMLNIAAVTDRGEDEVSVPLTIKGTKEDNSENNNIDLNLNDIIDSVIQNVDKFSDMPEDNREQIVRKFALAVFSKRFMDVTNQVTEEYERKFQKILDSSFVKVMKMQVPIGGFNLYRIENPQEFMKFTKDFLDLTAYIIKILGQYEILNPSFNKSSLNKAMEYIRKQQKLDGQFENTGNPQFKDFYKLTTIPGVSMTAYILISILESDYLKSNYKDVVNRGFEFIESKEREILHNDNIYEKVLINYLYVLAGKNHETFLNEINELAVHEDNKIYWNVRKINESSSTMQVEVSSYVALALIELNKYKEAEPVLNFLISKKNINGSFVSTTNTMIGLQALTAISKYVNARQKRSIIQKLTAETHQVEMTSTDIEEEHFELSVKASKEDRFLKLEICAATKDNQNTKMAIMEIELPNGFVFKSHDTDLEIIEKIKLEEENTKILLNQILIKPEMSCFELYATQKEEISSPGKSKVRLYDFDQPDKSEVVYYEII